MAGEMLGGIAWGGVREYRLLARLLLPEETIEAMALCRLRGAGPVGSQRLLVATPDRLLLVEKGLLSGRERMREIPLDSVLGLVVSPPGRLDLLVGEGRIELSLVQPARQLATLGCLIGARLDPTHAQGPDCDALFDFARRRLGRREYMRTEPSIVALAVELVADEDVLDIGWSTTGLVAATTQRLVIVPAGALRPGAPIACRYEQITGADLTDDGGIVIRGPTGARRHLGPLLPPGSADTLLWHIRTRAGS